MDFSLFKKIVDECAEHSVFSIKLSWRGEPTLNRQLVHMVKYAKDKGIRDVAFLTNGGLIDENMGQQLIDAGLDWISFSIDGLYEAYERIRYPIKFDKIVGVVKNFYRIKKREGRKKPLVRIQTISSTIKNFPEYSEFWKDFTDRISIIAEQHREDSALIKHDPNYICQAPFQRVFITWDGIVVPCHGDYLLHNRMGNVKEKSIQEIWQSPKFENFRKKMRARKRLEFNGCRVCPDGGEYMADQLNVGGKNIRIIRYLQNRDVSTSEEVEEKNEAGQDLG